MPEDTSFPPLSYEHAEQLIVYLKNEILKCDSFISPLSSSKQIELLVEKITYNKLILATAEHQTALIERRM